MKKRYFLTALFAASSLACSNASAVENKTINSEEDYYNVISTINSSEETDFVVTLGSDITLANFPSADDSVTIKNGKNVTFLGNGHKILVDQNGNYGHHSVLEVNSAVVNLGNAEGDILYIDGGGVNAPNSKSLIYVSGASSAVNMYDGVDIGNAHSGTAGLSGAVFRVGKNGTVNMYGGKIHDNSNTSNCYGGAVMLDAENGLFNMYDGIFENNATCTNYGAYGGAIFINDYDTQTVTVNIEGGTFKNNTSYFGGAIANLFGNLTIKNATFEGNVATGTVGESEPAGGAIVQYSYSTAEIDNCTFTGNNADSGGAIYDFAVRLDVTNSTFTNNTASLNGGAVLVGDYGTYVSEGNTYEGNIAKNGGAIYNVRGMYTFDDVITGNTAEIGGGIYAAGIRNTMQSYIYNNKATATSANDIYIDAAATNIVLVDASEFEDAFAEFDEKTLKVDGWYKDEAGDRYSYSNRTDNVTASSVAAGTAYYLTAAGNTEYVTVKFAGEGVDEDDKLIEKGTKLTSLPSPTRDGYEFGGWYIDDGFVDEFNVDNALEYNTTLYAKWVGGDEPVNPDDDVPGVPNTAGKGANIEAGAAETYSTMLLPVAMICLAGAAKALKKKSY